MLLTQYTCRALRLPYYLVVLDIMPGDHVVNPAFFILETVDYLYVYITHGTFLMSASPVTRSRTQEIHSFFDLSISSRMR